MQQLSVGPRYDGLLRPVPTETSMDWIEGRGTSMWSRRGAYVLAKTRFRDRDSMLHWFAHVSVVCFRTYLVQ